MKIIILIAFFGLVTGLSSCTKKYELGTLMDKSTLKYTIAPSSTNPNDIVLTSLTPNVTPVWVTPSGQSQRIQDTINIPFPGTYKFVYGVESDGGFVQADTAVVTINTLDQNAVSTPMWTDLTGGFGKSKTWVLDLDANGKSKFFGGPIYFAGTGWEWDAGWSGNSWICPALDYGTMTFDLIGNANFSSNNKAIPALGAAKGTFMMYAATNQLQTFGADVIHDGVQGPTVVNWNAKMRIQSLTDSTMQLIAVKDANDWFIYNYISQDYYNTH
ncbi:hypothetical protein [Arachidicoccus sp.]|uniref:hypothetical protein n=1 Tax=Arachidicoccus sp. TaxID=1872624 RepID=UPI003D2164A5